jgi:hypothetical protein
MLLNERGTYRSQWARLVGKTSPGEISQAAVAKVIVDHLRTTGDDTSQLDHRLFKDRVYRALSGRALTPSTLGLFVAAFRFSEVDARQLWALFLGATPDEARAAVEPPGFHVLCLADTHEVNSEGRPQLHTVKQRITATKDGVSRFPLRFDSAAVEIKAFTGTIGDIYRCADGLFAADVVLPKVLMRDEHFDVEYVIEYPADAKDDPEFLRGAEGKHIDSATIVVKFSPSRRPRTVWWMVLSRLMGGRTVFREQVKIDRKTSSVSKTVLSVEDVVIGFRWEWEKNG